MSSNTVHTIKQLSNSHPAVRNALLLLMYFLATKKKVSEWYNQFKANRAEASQREAAQRAQGNASQGQFSDSYRYDKRLAQNACVKGFDQLWSLIPTRYRCFHE